MALRKDLILAIALFLTSSLTAGGVPGTALHQPFDALLKTYVSDGLVKYDQLARSEKDRATLDAYVKALEKTAVSSLARDEQLAYWINMYNAVTLKLIVDNYPVKSIKDIGGLFSSPWKKKLVSVAGKELTLNDIENEIIRPQFKDARIHFALNCASIGCPPLHDEAFVAEKLDAQLELVTREALRQDTWLQIKEDEIRVTKIFDWYKEDFVQEAGSVRAYIARYREDAKDAILDKNRELKHGDYDWRLNKTP